MRTNRKDSEVNKLTLVTLLLSSMIILMGAAAVAPALKPLSIAFPESSAVAISLVVTLPALAVAITGLGVGYLADRYGKARVFIISLIVFTLAGMSGYFLNTLESVLAGRFILGIGIAGISTATTALTAEYYKGAARARVISYQSAAMGMGVFFLETLGGSLADIGWQEPFLIYLIGLPVLLLALISVREPARAESEESSLPEPGIENKGLKVGLCYSMIFVAMFLMFILPTNMPYHISDMGYSLFICGLLLGILGVSQTAFSLLYSRTSNKLGDRNAYATALLLIGTAYCLLIISSIVTVIFAMVLVGAGMGLITMTVIGSLSYYSQADGSGKIMGGYSVAMNLGSFSSSIIITPVVAAVGSYHNTFLYVGIFALGLCAVFAASAIIERQNIIRKRKDIVTRKATGDHVSLYDSILIATDGSETSNLAVRNGLDMAKNNVSKVTGLYVFDAEYYAAVTGSAPSAESVTNLGNTVSGDAMEYVIREAAARGVDVDLKVTVGHPAEMIIDESANHSLVVFGSVGRTNVSRILLGSVAEKVAYVIQSPGKEPDLISCNATFPDMLRDIKLSLSAGTKDAR